MSDRAERGPNGFPYPDMDDSKIGAWESSTSRFNVTTERRCGRTSDRSSSARCVTRYPTRSNELRTARVEVDYDG